MYCFTSEHNNCFKIIVFLCVFCFRRTCASDFFIAKQYGNDKYVCVTNSSYPITWVQEDITTPLSYKPFFIPVTNENTFDSRISLQDPTTQSFIRNPWSHIPSSVNSKVNGIILDRRWEELKTYMTESVEGKGTPLKYTPVLRNLRNDFEIPFSIRLKREGHVFLCDGDYPPNSNCYWFLLLAWEGNTTAIRKCSKGNIPSEHEKWTEAPCSNFLKKLDHINKPDSQYLSNQKWSHLKIIKKGNVLSLFSVNNKKEEKNIITLEDQKPTIGVTHMIIHSKILHNGLWKIHNMEFIYTTEESTKIHLGNPINPQDNYLCISLFIAMCTSCKMTLTLQDYYQSDVIEEKVYKFSSPGWSEIKFTTENIKQNNPVKFLVSTLSSSNDRFWAIDDIRICQRKEFRVIALTENATCQIMSEEDDVISLSTNVQRLDSSCSEDTIGDFCVPCTWVFDNCQQIKVCQKDKCVCSAGYQVYKGFGGEYYQCYGVPDPIWGLKFSEVSAKTVEIQWSSPDEIRGNFEHYIVEYGVVSYLGCRNSPTAPTKTRLKFVDNIARVNNLTPYATYSFSVSVANGVFESPPVTQEIKTEASDTIGPEEIPTVENLAAKSNLLDARLNTNCEKIRGPLMAKASAVCSDKWCDTIRKPKTLNIVTSNSLHLDNLSPFSNYTLYLQACRNESYCSNNTRSQGFKTQPAAPNPVNDLLVYSKNENSVSLRWTPPYPPNGILAKYHIQYYIWSRRSDSKIIEINQCTLWSNFHCATIDGLKTNQKYTFQVQAKNKEPNTYGDSQSITTTTQKEAPDPPYDLTIYWTSQNDLELNWNHPIEFNGEIMFFKINFNCGGRQIEKKLEIVDNAYKLVYNYTIKSTEIEPSRNCELYVHSNNGIQGSSVYKSDTSPPTIPDLDDHLKVNDVGKKIAKVRVSVKHLEKKNHPYLLLLISKENQTTSNEETTLLTLENFRLVLNCSLNKSDDLFDLIIGDNKQPTDCQNIKNPPLQEDTEYNVTVIIVNTFVNKRRNATAFLTFTTMDQDIESNINKNYFFILVSLLLILPVVLYYTKCRKQKSENSVFEEPGPNNIASNEMQELSLEHDYQNSILQSSKVQAEEFYNYVRTAESCGQLKTQHEIILETLTTYESVDEDFHLEYVDMNYSNGHQLRKVYIATQIPKKREINRFWNILWEENVYYIVFFDNNLNKGHQYWPAQNENMRVKNIFIECTASEKYEFYTCRIFTVTSNAQKRQIKQLHFSSNATEYPSTIKYVNFFREISNISLHTNSPILIHSSYGMSGNCFVLLCDISLRSASKDGVVDVMNNLRKLTEFSAQLIVDYDHYLLAHRIILEGILQIETSIDCASLDTNEPTNFVTPEQEEKFLIYLQKTWWLDCYSRNSQQQINIYCSVIPSNGNNSTSDQTKKILVEGIHNRQKFLVIPNSSLNTINRFWKQIEDENISVIISVDGDVVSSWLHKDISSIQLSSGTIIKNTNSREFSTYEWITVEMNDRDIEIFTMKSWSAEIIQPQNVSDFVNFCLETNEILNKHKFIAVTCHDVLTSAGLYVTMSQNIQKMKTEGISDICACIRLIRSQYRHFFNDEISYKFLMKATYRYMNEFSLYEVR